MKTDSKYHIDMTHGPLLGKIILFAIPLILTNALQLMFHAADLIVLGQFAAPEAMAAVGATNGLTLLMLNLFFGLATGVNVLAARYIGARDRRNVARTVHTSMAVAIYGGMMIALTGILISRPMLRLMATPEEILDNSCLYTWINCAGMPFVIIYNFGAAVLRALGDTRRPLIFIVIAGFTNVLLNLFFVLVCRWDVAGVAVATQVSNAVSAVLVLRILTSARDSSRLFWSRLKIHRRTFKDLLLVGLPSGIQGCCLSISNITIQSTVNSFGAMAIAGNTAAQSLEGFASTCCGAFYNTVISFVAQNHGAEKYRRIVKSIFLCAVCAIVSGIVVGWGFLFFGRTLLHIYNPNPEVIEWGLLRLNIVLLAYFLNGTLHVSAGALRGLGHSIKPTVVNLLGTCLFRIVWVVWIFPLAPTMNMLLYSYPVSWVLVTLVNSVILYFVLRKMFRGAAGTGHHPGAIRPQAG
ncbi:MAG: MATE family efflux transporter [Lentisphaeria bacterium]|nr:MATE family efflux transporter [Lentisphaeria bacterium]